MLFLALAFVVPGNAGASLTRPAPVPSAPALGTSLDFAVRAGFEAAHARETTDAVPASRDQSVDVVFNEPAAGPPIFPEGGPQPVGAFAQAHGLSAAAYSAAQRYFEAYGLRVVHTWPDRLALSLAGSPTELDRAFSTSLLAGRNAGRPVVYPSVAPSLPSWLEPEVAGVVGLASGFSSVSFSLAPIPGGATGNSITPGMARSMYNLSILYNLSGGPSYPTSEAVALLLWGPGYEPSDLATFFSQDYPSSFPLPTIAPYPLDGASAPQNVAPPPSLSQEAEELTLDIEWSGSMAPGATLDAVYVPGPSTANLTDAFEQALSLPNVVAVSMSFGAAESTNGALAAAWNPLFQEAADRDITVLAATGDTGGDLNASCGGGPAPEFPASSPLVIAVGGTAVTAHRTPLGSITRFTEAAWGGSGGGFSTSFRAPGWQQVGSAGTAITAAGGGRATPDVSATAYQDFVYYAGADQEADGTSFATPLWAGLVADLAAHAGHPMGFFTDRLYHFAANETAGASDDGLIDVTSGSNCVAAATTGWDAATGWGSPQAAVLYEQLAGSFVNITVDASSTTVAPGDALTVRAEIRNWTTGAPFADTAVALRLVGSTTVGPCTGIFESVDVTSNGTGWVSASLRVPACYLGARAVATASIETDRLYGHRAERIAVNLLGFVPFLEMLGEPPLSYLLFGAIVGAAIGAGGWLGRRRPPPSVPSVPAPVAVPPTPPPPTARPPRVPSSPPPSPPPAGPTLR
ncbi:MAG TPA: S53 family peptidase [Thermoplasmata archaeon]|nr:S53 family peptidase [Thermoplasmata archaeon]